LFIEMLEHEAKQLLDARVKDGARLVPAQQAALPAIKRLHGKCLDADIPALLGPCSAGG
jgi:hypothetical protein